MGEVHGAAPACRGFSGLVHPVDGWTGGRPLVAYFTFHKWFRSVFLAEAGEDVADAAVGHAGGAGDLGDGLAGAVEAGDFAVAEDAAHGLAAGHAEAVAAVAGTEAGGGGRAEEGDEPVAGGGGDAGM